MVMHRNNANEFTKIVNRPRFSRCKIVIFNKTFARISMDIYV